MGIGFISTANDVPYLQGTHHWGLVLLSLFVSIFSATMALQTAQIARNTQSGWYRQIAVGTGAIALGGGIWTMHFIGMLAFELPVHVHYSPGLTLVSFLPACAASWLALQILVRPRNAWPQLVVSGTLVGLGIGTMHYTGMAAMETALEMRYEPVMFALSLVVAVALAIFALWVRYGLRRTPFRRLSRLVLSGTLMGLAIASMHYTGMAAVRFIGAPEVIDPSLLFNKTFASLALSTFTIVVTVLVAVLTGLVRSRELYNRGEESKSRLRAILNTAVDGIITIDSRGLIQSFNHSAERLFGWTAEEVIGRNIKMLMPEPDQSRHDGYLQNYLTSGVPKIIGTGREVIGLRKDGSLMPMRLGVGRVDLPDELLFVGFVTDISERHALETSLRETAAEAERAAAAKSIFLANMSHEIRTPMNSIIGFTELLLQGDLTPTQRSHLDTIRQSSRSLLGLINDILDTTRMEKDGLELESLDFSLKGVAAQIESTLRLGAQARGLTLTTRYPAEMPEYFVGDPLRVLQILTNLVGNAIKFTERGGVDVVFDYRESAVDIAVVDTGIGMTQQQVDSIFAPFTQADASISRRFGGTGLGTTIARQLVELMGGTIELESELGKGSTFRIRLPLPVSQKPVSAVPDTARPPLPTLDILIADDVEQNLELLGLTLRDSGHRVTVARDGEEAVRAFKTARFDVVLMDVHMPGVDGLQATRLIRQHEREQCTAATPIIALTASVMAEDRRAASKAGMTGFAVKPLEVPQLFDEIARVLSLRPLTASTDGVERDHAGAAVIDWRAGVALWGSEARLTTALHQFLDTWRERYPLPDTDAHAIDWDAARFSLHGICGVAGNLALPAVSELAGTLEQLMAQQQYDLAMAQLPQLHARINAAQTALIAAETHDAPEKPAAESSTAELSVSEPSVSELAATEFAALAPAAAAEAVPFQQRVRRSQVGALMAVLQHNELDDALQEQVCVSLEASGAYAQAQALRNALDGFEFDQARAVLEQVLAEPAP